MSNYTILWSIEMQLFNVIKTCCVHERGGLSQKKVNLSWNQTKQQILFSSFKKSVLICLYFLFVCQGAEMIRSPLLFPQWKHILIRGQEKTFNLHHANTSSNTYKIWFLKLNSTTRLCYPSSTPVAGDDFGSHLISVRSESWVMSALSSMLQ